MTVDDAVEISRALHAAGCDLIDVSSAGNSPDSEPVYGLGEVSSEPRTKTIEMKWRPWRMTPALARFLEPGSPAL